METRIDRVAQTLTPPSCVGAPSVMIEATRYRRPGGLGVHRDGGPVAPSPADVRHPDVPKSVSKSITVD